MTVYVLPYSPVSMGAKRLAKQLGIKRLFDKAFPVVHKNDVLINWGKGLAPKLPVSPLALTVLNPFPSVMVAINKKSTFERLKDQGVRVPKFTVDPIQAGKWLAEGYIVFGREKLEGTRGEGIVVLEGATKGVISPKIKLFVQYKKKKKEFRIHVFKGSIIDFQEKRIRTTDKKGDQPKADSLIRSEERGWVFCRQNVVLPEDAKVQAIKACNALGLDFGGVDVIWNEGEDKAYVLEINTAPGIEGTTVKSYADAIKKWLPTI